jgi:hypothetical protein
MRMSNTPLMTNLLPSAVGADGRVNLFVGNVSCIASFTASPHENGPVSSTPIIRAQADVRSQHSPGFPKQILQVLPSYSIRLMGSREDAARAIGAHRVLTFLHSLGTIQSRGRLGDVARRGDAMGEVEARTLAASDQVGLRAFEFAM